MSVKKLGFGLMRLPAVDEADKSKVDVERVCHLADRFLAEGFTYFDTAFPYHKGTSEEAAKKAYVPYSHFHVGSAGKLRRGIFRLLPAPCPG